MGKALKRIAVVAMLLGAIFAVLRKLGLVGGEECTASCACSSGSTACHCGHKTCLAPAPGA